MIWRGVGEFSQRNKKTSEKHQRTKEPTHARSSQIKNGIPHQLAWTVVGDLTTSVGKVKLGTCTLDLLLLRVDVALSVSSSSGERRRMFYVEPAHASQYATTERNVCMRESVCVCGLTEQQNDILQRELALGISLSSIKSSSNDGFLKVQSYLIRERFGENVICDRKRIVGWCVL